MARIFVTLSDMEGWQYTQKNGVIVGAKISAKNMASTCQDGGVHSFKAIPPNGFVNFHVDGDVRKMVQLPVELKNLKVDGASITFEMALLPDADAGLKTLTPKALVQKLNAPHKDRVSIFVDEGVAGGDGIWG